MKKWIHKKVIEDATCTLYHGSHHNIKGNYIIPRNNSYEDDNYVFATSDKDFALAYCGNIWFDDIIGQGYYNDELYLVEMKKGIFDKVFNTDGYIYTVDHHSGFFQRGMKTEYLTTRKTKILDREYIPNVLEAIENSDIKLYRYPNKPEWFDDIRKQQLD